MIKKIINLVIIFSLVNYCSFCYALDKEEFLKFLINSSYPETSNTENKNKDERINNEENSNTKENETVKQTSKTETTNTNEGFVKVYIGKENAPKQKNEETKETEETKQNDDSVVSNDYRDNVKITKEEPKIFIYHTHSSETYSDSPKGNFHSDDIENSVMKVGKELTNELEKRDWGVLHTIKYHDAPDYNKSYVNSLKTIKDILNKNKSLEIAIDIHRDARVLETKSQIEEEQKRMVATINGEKVAKFFFVVGPDNKNVQEIRKIANDLTKLANQKYPGIALSVIEKEYGKFNQYLAKNHMLVEIGSNGTSTEEALKSTKYLAEVLDEYFKNYK